MDDHPGVLEQRVEPLAVRRRDGVIRKGLRTMSSPSSPSCVRVTKNMAGRESAPGSRMSARPTSAPSIAQSRMLPSCPAHDAAKVRAGESARELYSAT